MRGIDDLFDNGFRVRFEGATDNDEACEYEIVLQLITRQFSQILRRQSTGKFLISQSEYSCATSREG